MSAAMSIGRRTAGSMGGRMRRGASASDRQRGLTLVELMVAIVLGILVAGAAVATLIVARQGGHPD